MAQDDNKLQEDTPTLEAKINASLKSADSDGKIDFGENPDPVFKKLVLTEKKARLHQANSLRTARELAEAKAANTELTTMVTGSAVITAEQQEELDELKFSDPDAWFSKKQQYESEAQKVTQEKMTEAISAASEKAVQELTLTERTEALKAFTSSTGIELTDDVMMNDVPPRLQQKMGSMPFEDYLQEVATYLGKGKVIKPTDEGVNQTDLEKLPGGSAKAGVYEPDLGDGII